jgi:DNA repair exonuclease SbcCD ATPase subunit
VEEYFPYDGIGSDVEDLVEESLQGEESRLRESLERVDELLEERKGLRERHVDELGSKLDWYVDRLETLYRRPGTGREEIEELKQRIESIYDSLRDERRSAWRDRQELEAERRELLRELRQLEEDQDIVDWLD